MKHKQAELIKVQSDGHILQIQAIKAEDVVNPKSDIVHETKISLTKPYIVGVKMEFDIGKANLKLTFDGETGDLKGAEVIK